MAIERVIEGLHVQLTALYELVGEIHSDAVIKPLAATFSRMDDDQQAKFFVEVAREMGKWTIGTVEGQAYHIGRHLAICKCATPEAREFLLGIVEAMTLDSGKEIL